MEVREATEHLRAEVQGAGSAEDSLMGNTRIGPPIISLEEAMSLPKRTYEEVRMSGTDFTIEDHGMTMEYTSQVPMTIPARLASNVALARAGA